jgi:secondary thiamine-phosphate synthase enzyme
MHQSTTNFQMTTQGPGLYDISDQVITWVASSGIETGVLTLFITHTSASLTVQENADPKVQDDLHNFFKQLVSRDPSLYAHGAEGPDDMPAHIRSALTDVSLSIPIEGGRPTLGTWQGVYLFEHRDSPHSRTIKANLMGE